MTISFEEAVNFASFAYAEGDENFALPQSYVDAGWQELIIPDLQEYPNGYDGFAYVKIVDGTVKELVIAHRGTEFSAPIEVADIIQDIESAVSGAEGPQAEEMRDFVSRVQEEYEAQIAEGQFSGPAEPISLITHTGHSLGGYLAILAANDAGADGRAITFDNPQTYLTSTEADIKTILSEPNLFNQAGTGEHVGEIYLLPETNVTPPNIC